MEQEKRYSENENETRKKIQELQERLVQEDFIKTLEVGELQAETFAQTIKDSRSIPEKIRKKSFDVRSSQK